MVDGVMKASDRRDKASVDKISAAIILQGYLDRLAGPSASGTGFAPDMVAVPESRMRKKTGKRR